MVVKAYKTGELSPGGGETLIFHFGIGVQPEGPNREACERITAEFGSLVSKLNCLIKSSLVNWILAN